MTGRADWSGRALGAFTLLVYAFILAPIIVIIVFSFNADRFPTLVWGGFSLEWYRAILTDDTVRQGLWRSLGVAAVVSVVSTAIGFTAAYVDYRWRFPGKTPYLILVSLPPTTPVLILGLSMLSFFSLFDFAGSLRAVVVGHVVLCAPFAMALIRLRLRDMSPDLEPAAWNLGATRWATMRAVVIPFCAPSIFAALAITAAVSFDEFMIAWFVSGLQETLPVRVLAMLQGQVSPRINAIGSIVFVTTIMLAAIAQALTARRAGDR
jgi:spermidine/putrescine transport system permease protein